MLNIFLMIFFVTLAFAFLNPFFFVGYLISIAIFGLYQALFMANAGGAWDNAKKLVEVELKEKGTEAPRRDRGRRHRRRSVQGHLVGRDEPGHQVHDLFGLLAVQLVLEMRDTHPTLTAFLAVAFFVVALVSRTGPSMRCGSSRSRRSSSARRPEGSKIEVGAELIAGSRSVVRGQDGEPVVGRFVEIRPPTTAPQCACVA
jgi:K(+)-stimulated pyrophosphate-energized sodium pump